jgi:adenylyl-sulfate kinase
MVAPLNPQIDAMCVAGNGRIAAKTGCVVWLTGLSGSGKTTLANAVAARLSTAGFTTEILDGDVLRGTLCKDLGFTPEDREENIRRISFVADLLARNGVIVFVAAIAPYRRMRQQLRAGCARYFEVFVNAPLDVCEQRDPKGLYRRARMGELDNFTGVHDPYETPESPEVECRTDQQTVRECEALILSRLIPFLEGIGSDGEGRHWKSCGTITY